MRSDLPNPEMDDAGAAADALIQWALRQTFTDDEAENIRRNAWRGDGETEAPDAA